MAGQAGKVVPIEETKLFCQPFPVRSVPDQKLQPELGSPLHGGDTSIGAPRILGLGLLRTPCDRWTGTKGGFGFTGTK